MANTVIKNFLNKKLLTLAFRLVDSTDPMILDDTLLPDLDRKVPLLVSSL